MDRRHKVDEETVSHDDTESQLSKCEPRTVDHSFTTYVAANAFTKRIVIPLAVGAYWGLCVVVGSCVRHYQTTRTYPALMPTDWGAAQAPVNHLLVSISLGLAVDVGLFGIGLLGLISLGLSLMPAPEAKSVLHRVRTSWIAARLIVWGSWTLKAFIFIYAANTFVSSLGMTMAADLTLGANGGLLWAALYNGGKVPSDSRVDGVRENGVQYCKGDACSQRIEKIIHQTYITANTSTWPEAWRDTPSAWKKHHPDWKYMFWTDESARTFIETEYPWFLSHFDAYPFPIQRADAIRYFVLYHYGGLYADLDLQPKHSLDKYLVDTDVALFETPNLGLTNMIVASRKGSPFMKCVAAKLASYQWQVHHEFARLRAWRILTGTGPTYLWGMTSRSLCGHNFVNHNEKLRIVSGEATGRCSLCGGVDMQKCAANGLLKHIQGSSWHGSAKDVKIINFAFLCHPGVVAGMAITLAISASAANTIFVWSAQSFQSRGNLAQLTAPRCVQVLVLVVMNYVQLFPILSASVSRMLLCLLVFSSVAHLGIFTSSYSKARRTSAEHLPLEALTEAKALTENDRVG